MSQEMKCRDTPYGHQELHSVFSILSYPNMQAEDFYEELHSTRPLASHKRMVDQD